MASTIGDALNTFLRNSRWLPKIHERKLQTDWETIVGKTIARYTRDLKLNNGTLSVATDVAVLKQELQFGKIQLMERINEYFGTQVVKEIIIR